MWQLYMTMWQSVKMSVKPDRMSVFGSNRIVTRGLLCQKRSSYYVLPTTGRRCVGGVAARGGGLSGLKPENPPASVPTTPRTTTKATADNFRHTPLLPTHNPTHPTPSPHPLARPSGAPSPAPARMPLGGGGCVLSRVLLVC